MRAALPLLVLTAAALLGAALWPRAGQAVALVFPPGLSPAPAFAAAEWRVLRTARAGPFALVVLAPETAAADPALLRRATGAPLAILAARVPGCSAIPIAKTRRHTEQHQPWT